MRRALSVSQRFPQCRGLPLSQPFSDFLRAATPGARIVYFRSSSGAELGDAENRPLRLRIQRAWCDGLVELFQRRRADGGLDYEAHRTRRTSPLPRARTFPVASQELRRELLNAGGEGR